MALTSLEKKYGTPGSIQSASRQSASSSRNSLEEKYGTIDEIRALDEHQDSFKRFSLGAGAVAKYLQSDSWDDNKNHQWYSDLVSSRQQEISDAMASAGDNRALKSRLQQYADTYGSLAQGLTDRQSFFGQFQSKADYSSYASAVKAARSTKAAGKSYDDWYRQANADIETASGRVTDLEHLLADAQHRASTGLWDGGVYLGEDKSAAEEAKRLKAELERARQDEADKRRIGSYAQAWRYEDLPETTGFSSAAEKGLRQFSADSAAEHTRELEQRAQREAEFNAGGTGGLVYEDDLMTQLRSDTSWREPTEDWTEQERNTFGYLYAQDPARAYEYGQYINDRNKAQTRYEQEQKVGDWADKNIGTRAASAAAGILTMPAALADYLDYAAEYAARGTVTQRESLSLADYGNVMVGAVSQGLNERYGTIDSKIIGGFDWGDIYQLGVSIGQSMVWGGAGKALGGAVGLAGEAAAHFGSAATLGMFFGSAAKSGFEDARARGVDDGKALWYGFASGIAEAGCEVLSLDKLLTIKSPTSLTKLLKNVLVQSGVEASEELATTICNRISDQLINGDKSEIATKIALGMAKGMSYEEAAKEAEKEWLQSAARDAVGGFLSGGVSGGMASGIESLGRYQGNTAQLIDQGLASGGDAEAIARDMQGWMRRGQETATTTNQSAAQTAPLAQGSQSEQSSQTQERESEEPKKNGRTRRISNLQAQRLIEAIEETDRGKLKNAVEAQLTRMQENRVVNENGEETSEGKNVSLIAEAVAKSVQGDKLNRAEEEALKSSRFGKHLVQELSAEKLMGGGSIPEWVRNIGAERLGGGLYSDVAEVVRSTLRGEGLKSTQGRVSVNGERATFTRLEKNSEGETVALVTKADGSTQQVAVDSLDFGYNSLLGEAVKEMAAQKSGPAMMAMYREGQDLGAYIDAWQIGEIYGSRSSATAEAAWEDAGKAIQQDIERSQFQQAFEMGRREREARIAEREKEKKEKGEKKSERAVEDAGPYKSGREGKVTFGGAEIDGVKYDAVDKNRLTTRQKRQIAALEELARVTGVNIVFYQTKADSKGRFRGANGAFFNNTIYLDVNAGMRDSRDNLRVAIIRTAAHELTHYIQANNAEGYEALQSFLLDRLIEWKGRSLAELAEDKLARDTTGTLSMEQAIDEVVADGCEMMLRRSSVAEQLAREDKSLFERISDWVKGWTQKIRDAFEGVEAYHDEAKAMEKHADELQKRWDAALLGAIRNDRSGQGTKNAAPEGGGVQYEIREIEDTGLYYVQADRQVLYGNDPDAWGEQLTRHINRNIRVGRDFALNTSDGSILLLTATTAEKGAFRNIVYENGIPRTLTDEEYLAKLNAEAHIDELARISTDRAPNRQNTSDENNLHGDFAKNGWRYRVAYFMDFDGRYYELTISVAHGSKGKVVYNVARMRERSFPTFKGSSNQKTGARRGKTSFSGERIAETKEEVNTQLQERDFMPDDRELLLEATEGGQSGRELQEYRKKAQKLEEHQRRLQRLQEAAESAEGAEKDKITEKLRKTEKSILNAEAALRKMEATPQLKRALEKATAAWRDANPNEAARTLRRLREQNRTQQELIEYWQQQARRTEPGKETLRKDDIRRAARALLKEHQSEADVDQVSGLLQELGDFMAQNSAGAGVSFYEEARRRAGRIARLIVRNIYQTEDSHAELRQEVRDYLRKTPIQITDYIRADMPELDYLRKKHMGVLRLNREGASLDEVYQSLGDQFGQRWFPPDVTAPSDQLNQIVDALESLEPSYYEMYRDYEVREISEIVAGEIIDTLLSGDVRQSETVADRAYQQMQERLQRETDK